MALSKLKRIAPIQAALAVGLVYLVIGLILGVLAAVGLTMINSWLAQYAGLTGLVIPLLSSLTGVLFIIVFPVSGFIIGFLGTLITLWIYNWIAKKVPIKLELK